jgi:serine protease inhibitor
MATLPLDPATLTIANALWLHQGTPFLPAYLETLQAQFQTTPHFADFDKNPNGAVAEINAWVHTHTMERIQRVLDKVDPLTRLLLVNAIAFKGK